MRSPLGAHPWDHGGLSRDREQGNGRCEAFTGCTAGATTALCTIEGSGHSWPGGLPNVNVTDCPADGPQSTTFSASEAIWSFFAAHPRQP